MSTIVPVRGLGSGGIVTDISPAALDDQGQSALGNAYSAGKNVRFKNGAVTRGPVARTVARIPFEPVHVHAIPPSANGFDELVVVSSDFGEFARINGARTDDLTPEGHIGSEGIQAVSSSILGGVSYINRETHVPQAKRPQDERYAPLTTWPENWTAKILRPYRDFMVALAPTQEGVAYPTKVVWSDPVLINEFPKNWEASETNSAGESTSNSMQHPIVDGLELRESFMLYCTASVWVMEYIGGNFLFSFRKVWDERSVIAPNCVVQVGGIHYVFGRDDLWSHDGSSERSVATGKIRDRVFRELDYSRAHLCFVTYDPRLNEVRWHYPSKGDDVAYVNPETGCNRSAVLDLTNGTWSFDDMPNVTSGTRGAILTGGIFDEEGDDVAFDEDGGLFDSADGDDARHSLYVGRTFEAQGLTAPRLYGFDSLTGGRLSLPPEPEALKDSYVERTGIDLDALGKHLTQMVRIQAIWPQCRKDLSANVVFEVGANNIVVSRPEWSDPMPFDPEISEKLWCASTGKYLAYRVTCSGLGDFELSSMDVQLNVRGRR